MKPALLLTLLVATAAQATPGRTDAKGCHTNKKAGYHCHGSPKKAAPAPKPAAAPKGKPHAIPKVDQASAGRAGKPQQ